MLDLYIIFKKNEWRRWAKATSIEMEKMERTKIEIANQEKTQRRGWHWELCSQLDPKNEQSFSKK